MPTNSEKQSADALISRMSHTSSSDRALVRKAYEFSLNAHKKHSRMSGEPYFNHVYATALALASLDMDAQTVAAGLLHDSIEDLEEVTPEIIVSEFGEEVLFLVQGVTKLGALKYRGAARHIESHRRLFVATSKDIRVVIIKLMDRLHNMQTLEHVRPEKRDRIAEETISVYVPLADRLGMGLLKRQLEDLSFQWLQPDKYKEMEKIMRENKIAREPQLDKVRNTLKRTLAEEVVKKFRTESRVKGLYSLYTKLGRKDGDLDKIHDLLAIRIILKTVEDCYRVLGIVHTLWVPLPGKIKDYISFNKPNGYRSIHTTVITEEAGPVEIQIRTEEMHKEAQYGIASHTSYKESGSSLDRGQQKRERLWYRQFIPSLLSMPWSGGGVKKSKSVPKWVNDLADAHNLDENSGTSTLMQEIRNDFFSHRIFVFTPKGDVVDLPISSTPIDFAYAIHSEIGNHTARAKVNGKLSSLDSTLRNGDIVEIETSKTSHPTSKWTDYVRTTLARRHVHQYLAKNKKRARGA